MLHILASGSSGNSYCIHTEEEYIFIDIGINGRKINDFLKSNEYNDEKISLFITHEHTDHISGIKHLLKYYSPTVYASRKTAVELSKKHIGNYPKLYQLLPDEYYEFDNFAVRPFDINHDSVEPFGFIFSTITGNTAFMTDLGCITKHQLDLLAGTDTLILEANHDKVMLAKGPYHARLKQRVKSVKGHLSNDDAMMAIAALSKESLTNCLFAHISEQNNSYELLEDLASFATSKFGVTTKVLKQNEYYKQDLCPFANIKG